MSFNRALGILLLAGLTAALACTSDPPDRTAAPPSQPASDPSAAGVTARVDTPELVQEGLLGEYNVIRVGKRYYALAQDEGAFEKAKADAGQYRRCFIASNLTMLRTMTQDGVNQGFGSSSTMLVEQGYTGGFNIIRARGRYFALGEEEGAFVYEKASRGAYRRLFAGSSLADVKAKIR
jgi:hypothetical protein